MSEIMVFVSLCRTYLAQHHALQVQPCCCKWQDFILFFFLWLSLFPLLPHVGVEPAPSESQPLLPVSMGFLLYILSYKTSVQLDFRRLLMRVVLHFSCNFDVVFGGGECSIYLLLHLDYPARF